jgi:hypothetical protein
LTSPNEYVFDAAGYCTELMAVFYLNSLNKRLSNRFRGTGKIEISQGETAKHRHRQKRP